MSRTLLPLIIGLLALTFFNQSHAQINFNLEKVSNIDYDQLVADVWGYVGPDSTEYAIVGTFTGTSIISLANPEEPEEVLFIPGAQSIWRDIHNWGDHLYIVADRGNDGILIVDMSQSPDSIHYEFWSEAFETSIGDSSIVVRSHNLWIDEKGYLYLSGSNMNSGGVVIFDIHSDPWSPQFKGMASPVYSHDNYAINDMLYSANITAGTFSIYDITDRTNPIFLNDMETTSRFTHNCWLSDDGRYLFTTDERPDSYVDAYDVSDPLDIQYVNSFRPLTTDGTGVIPHNVHYFNGFLVVSWYTDGIVIVDAHRPDNMVKVAQYDTFLGPHGGFNGAWGAYPYLPSGLVLGSDRQTGMYVLEPDYKRAAYLEGLVTDVTDGSSIRGVTVDIDVDVPNTSTTGISGFYKTGTAFHGTQQVTFAHPDYEDVTIEVELTGGEVTELNVQMVPLHTVFIEGTVFGSDDEILPLENAKVELQSAGETISETLTESNGSYILTSRPGVLDIVAGKWGYSQAAVFDWDSTQHSEIDFTLEKGLADDFILDMGWTVSHETENGRWQRVIPNGSQFGDTMVHPDSDVDFDLGDFAWVTGQPENGDPLSDFPGPGINRIESPEITPFHLNDNNLLGFSYWFYNQNDDTLNTINVYGTMEIGVLLLFSSSETTDGWVEVEGISLSPLFSPFNWSTQIFVQVVNQTGEVVVGGFDALKTYDTEVNTTDQRAEVNWVLFPNPSDGLVTSMVKKSGAEKYQLVIYNSTGKQITSQIKQGEQQSIDLSGQSPGIYFVQLLDRSGTVLGVQKLVITD